MRGDHLQATRQQGHHHDGIDLGDGTVIHFAAGPRETKTEATIRIDSWEVFANGGVVSTRRYSGTQDPEETVARAVSRLGDGNYDLVFNNCEHFARWAVTGDHFSEQVTAVTTVGGVVGSSVAAVVMGGDVIASAGLVAGVSGPGIMSGLAATGGIVGGGAVAGLGVLAAGPGAVSVMVLHHAMRDDEALSSDEREARSVGRVGSVIGAGGTLVGGLGAVSALGTVAGLSGAGITSGLAAIGAGAGGGMATGAVFVVAAPALGAAIIGYGFYRVFRWLRS